MLTRHHGRVAERFLRYLYVCTISCVGWIPSIACGNNRAGQEAANREVGIAVCFLSRVYAGQRWSPLLPLSAEIVCDDLQGVDLAVLQFAKTLCGSESPFDTPVNHPLSKLHWTLLHATMDAPMHAMTPHYARPNTHYYLVHSRRELLNRAWIAIVIARAYKLT